MNKAVILAGGKGTRLYPTTKTIPKPLLKIGDKSVIEHQILLLKEYGIKEIWILSGFLGSQIKEFLQDGQKFGVNIHYHQEKTPLGTAGALKVLENEIKEDFLVFSGDVMMDFDIQRFINWHKEKSKSIMSILVHPNDHPFDSDLVDVDKDDRIISLLRRPHPPEMIYRNLSIASAYIFSPGIFKYIPKIEKSDIEKDMLPFILESGGEAYAYNTPEYLKDMGTPERLKHVRKDELSGKINRLNLKNKRKAIFLDRDGVINKQIDQLSKIEEFEMHDFAFEAIKKINNSEYLAIIITNQPMIAKGFLSEEELYEMHKKLETELGNRGAKIDAIYYCPHHPEKGFEGEIPELKIECDCRKPKTGLIKKATSELNVDLSKSFFIGDSSIDAKTAENAEINFVGVKTGYACQDKHYEIKQGFPLYDNLLTAVNNLI